MNLLGWSGDCDYCCLLLNCRTGGSDDDGNDIGDNIGNIGSLVKEVVERRGNDQAGGEKSEESSGMHLEY